MLYAGSVSPPHYSDIIMSAMASQIQFQHCSLNHLFRHRSNKTSQSSVSLAFVREIHRWPMNSPHKLPVTRKMFKFDDVIMNHVWLAQLIAGAVTYFQHIKWETNEMTVTANVLFKLLHNQRKRYVNDTFDWLRSITETVISPFW